MKLKDRMRLSIRRRAGQVVLRADVAALGSASQVSLALKELQREGELIRLGAGVYAKAVRDAETGEPRSQAAFETLADEAARKLKLVSASAPVGGAEAVLPSEGRGRSVVLDTGRRRISRKLALGSRSVAYVNDRVRRQKRRPGASSEAGPVIPTTDVAQFVRELADRHQITYTPTPTDRWAEAVTRLAGDEVRSGPVQDLLVALKRAGKLSADDMTALMVSYLRERKQGVRSV